MKALDEYFLMVVFPLLLDRLHVFTKELNVITSVIRVVSNFPTFCRDYDILSGCTEKLSRSGISFIVSSTYLTFH